MFGKRKDGRLVKTAEPIQKIMPYIMKTRTDSMNLFEETIDCKDLDEYIAKRSAQGRTITYMHLYIAGAVRLIALRPQLNRFVVHGKIYARNEIWVSFMVHQTLKDDSAGTCIKLCFKGDETIDEIADKIDEAIARERNKAKTKNSTDVLTAKIMSLPGFLIRGAVNFLMFLDKHGLLPKSVIDASPFHTSFFITNMKSLGISPIYHHVYEFGTTGIFIALGKEKRVPCVASDDSIYDGKRVGVNVVTDERFCDGLYFARSFRMFLKMMANPEVLEERPERVIQDID